MDFVFQKSFLSLDEQQKLVASALSVQPGFYIPKTRWGKSMSLRMNCLGWHWSAKDYKYHKSRIDVDGLPCAPIPDEWQALAQKALIETDHLSRHEIRPFDTCIANLYDADSKLGDHVDNSEGDSAIESGYPVVSLSIGASCIFRMGGLKRTDPYAEYLLQSGDLVIFGKSKRLAFHGVKKLLPDSSLQALGLADGQRLNFTFRAL
jgi:alkylated DNA repair protein (DNA oxidative demethylase)